MCTGASSRSVVCAFDTLLPSTRGTHAIEGQLGTQDRYVLPCTQSLCVPQHVILYWFGCPLAEDKRFGNRRRSRSKQRSRPRSASIERLWTAPSPKLRRSWRKRNHVRLRPSQLELSCAGSWRTPTIPTLTDTHSNFLLRYT